MEGCGYDGDESSRLSGCQLLALGHMQGCGQYGRALLEEYWFL